MPVVRVKGVANPMQFPDDMDIEDIKAFLQRRFANQAVAGNQPMDLAPLQGQARASEQSLAQKAGQGISNALVDSGIISDRFGAQQIGKNVTSIGEFLPGIGDATAGDEFGRALKQGDNFGMAMGALGAIPLVGDAAKKVVDSPLFKVHNITEGGLAKADEFGGIPSPSIAIAGGNTGFDSFGDISLVGNKDSFLKDPTFASDVYSPRTPRAKDKIDVKAARAEENRISGLVDPQIDSGFSSQFDPSRLSEDISRLEESTGNKAAFLSGIGQDVNPANYTSLPDKPKLTMDGLGFALRGKRLSPREFREDAGHIEATKKWLTQFDEKGVDVSFWRNTDGTPNEDALETTYKSMRRERQALEDYSEGPKFDRSKARNDIDKRVSENKESFNVYIKNQKSKLSTGQVFEKFNPNTGTSKKFEANLANAVKLMKGNIRGGEGFNYGVGSIRAQATPQLKSLSQIQNRRGQIVGEDEMTMVKEGFDSRLDNLYDSLKGNWSYGGEPSYSDFSEGVTAAAKGDFADFKDLSAEQRSEMNGFFTELANAPTNYFEVKPQRAVNISEFYGAAVPIGTSKAVIDGLKNQGLNVVKYKPDQRKKAIESLNKKSGGAIFFSGGGAAILYGGSSNDEDNLN
jgi:hypothetical protein